ncbi:MAG: cadmium-translocating P-type ATPase [Spirochaetes bacterium]|nr:cadmium-translocating P-type ATPase [Spirochaetota bacterium]
MIKTYILQGLECPNCAAKIESAVQKLNGVSSASVNFITARLNIEMTDRHTESIHQLIEKTVHKYEPDINVIESENITRQKDHLTQQDSEGSRQIAKLVAGAAVFGLGIMLEQVLFDGKYIPLAVFIASYLILGGGIILRALKNITAGQLFDENFLMSIATIGAFAIGEYSEAVAVMLFFCIGEYFQDMAVRRSKKSITDLMDIRPDFANLKKNEMIIQVSPDTVNIGDTIVVKPGEKIPLDGIVIEGESMIDTMALTGESKPRKTVPSDTVLSGCINQSGVLIIEVTKSFGESTVTKIIDLVENSGSKKAPTENFITAFSRIYTPVVVGLALLIAVIPALLTGGLWHEWINRGLIFLVISCPCALVISIPLGFFGGIGGASKNGVLVKGGNYLEALANLDIVVFDKTGTLTKGVFNVTSILPANGKTENDVLELAAYGEAFSNHPIALSIQRAYAKAVDKNALSEYEEIAGYGIRVKMNGKVILAGNSKLMERMEIPFTESQNVGTKVYVASDKEYAGCIVISDEIKPDSHKAITALKARGVRKIVMLTGDNSLTAEAVAKELALDEAYANLLPAQKVECVEALDKEKRSNCRLAFIGDGINDAPVLARADVGVAMGALGSDAAIEAADVVLMTDEPSKLAEAIDIARFTKRIVWQNIIFALGVKALVMLLGVMGAANLWEAVFADVGVALLAVLNAARAIRH